MQDFDIIPVAYCPICRGDVARHDVIIDLAEKYSKTPAQIALRWIYQQKLYQFLKLQIHIDLEKILIFLILRLSTKICLKYIALQETSASP